MFAVSLAIISQEFFGRERGTAFGIWGATVGAAVAIGPLVGGALTTYVGWRWIFFVNVPIGVACVAVGTRVLHETRDEQAGRFDVPGLLTLTGGLFALVLGLLRGADWGWSSGRVVGLFAAAAVLLVSFAFVELRRESPMLDIRLFRVPTFTGAQITAFAISSGMFAQFLFLPLYLESVLGYSAVKTGVIFLPLSLLAFVVAPISGRLSTRVPVRFLLGGGLALCGVALLLMHGLTLGSTWTALLPGFLVAGVGIGLVNAPLASTSVSVVEPRHAGMASGTNNTFRQVGIATGIAALGAIFQSRITSFLSNAGIGPFVPSWSREIASGLTPQRNFSIRNPQSPAVIAHEAFISGLNTIFVVAAVVLFVGAVLAFLLVRRKDFVASQAPAPAGAG